MGHFNHFGAGALGRAECIFIGHQMNHIKEGMHIVIVSTLTTVDVVQSVLCKEIYAFHSVFTVYRPKSPN